MKVIIAGSRDLYDQKLVDEAVIASDFAITEVVSGKARGIDTLGENWAKANNVPVKPFPADWDFYGPKRAGPIRNQQMADYVGKEGALIAIPGPDSRGTHDMIRRAVAMGMKVFVFDGGMAK